VTSHTVVRIWLAFAWLGLAGLLVVGGIPSQWLGVPVQWAGRGAVPVAWTEGAIAPRYIYAPTDLSYQVEVPDPGAGSLEEVKVPDQLDL